MTLKQIYVRNLKEFRKKEGLSQMKLAEFCDTATSYIGDIEIGRRFPSMEMIEKIANILRIKPYLFFKEQADKIENSETENLFPRLPNSMKKQIKTQIKIQIDQSTSEILNEIDEIINKYWKIYPYRAKSDKLLTFTESAF